MKDWNEAVAFALTLPGTELSTSYGKPAVKVNGRAFLYIGREEETSFGVAIDLDTVEMLKETDPDTFWQTRIMKAGRQCSSATAERIPSGSFRSSSAHTPGRPPSPGPGLGKGSDAARPDDGVRPRTLRSGRPGRAR